MRSGLSCPLRPEDRYGIPGEWSLRSGVPYLNGGRVGHWRGIYDDKDRLMVAVDFNRTRAIPGNGPMSRAIRRSIPRRGSDWRELHRLRDVALESHADQTPDWRKHFRDKPAIRSYGLLLPPSLRAVARFQHRDEAASWMGTAIAGAPAKKAGVDHPPLLFFRSTTCLPACSVLTHTKQRRYWLAPDLCPGGVLCSRKHIAGGRRTRYVLRTRVSEVHPSRVDALKHFFGSSSVALRNAELPERFRPPCTWD